MAYRYNTFTRKLDYYKLQNYNSSSLLTDHRYEGITITEPIGEDVTFGDGLYFDWPSKTYKISDADAVGTMPVVGIAVQDNTTSGTSSKILAYGWIRDDSYRFASTAVYASCTPGEFTTTTVSGIGDQVQTVGYATASGIMFFNPCYTLVEVT